MTANAQPVPQPATPQPEVETRVQAPATPNPAPIRQGVDMDDLAGPPPVIHNIEERTKRLRMPNGLTELENEPALQAPQHPTRRHAIQR